MRLLAQRPSSGIPVNRSPVSGRDKTPWEPFFGKKPDVSGLATMRVFAAEAYALIPKQLRRKLDGHSELGHFVGYSTGKKGYRIALASGEVRECGDHHRRSCSLRTVPLSKDLHESQSSLALWRLI